MSNAALALNSLPAERMRGCRFAQRFYNQAAMLADNWFLTNAPTFNNGITVDGVNQKAEHREVIRGVQSVSFWVTLGSTTEDILQLSAAHSIEVGAGTLTATGWAAPTIMVNGVVTAVITTVRSFVTVTTANPFDADDIAVGEVAAYGDFKMEDLKIWGQGAVLSLQETLDYTNSATWNWENLLDINLQMRMQDYDPTAFLTHDSSGYGTHFTLGNGAGALEPVQGRGRMTYAGGEFLQRAAVAQPAGAFTVAFTVNHTTEGLVYLGSHMNAAATDVSWIVLHTGGHYRFYVGDTAVYARSSTFQAGGDNRTVVGVWDGTSAWIYIDGVLDTTIVGVPVQPAGPNMTMYIGSSATPASFHFGDIFDFKYRDGQAWTPIQIMDFHIRSMRAIGAEF